MKRLTLVLAITFLTAGLSSAQGILGIGSYSEAPPGVESMTGSAFIDLTNNGIVKTDVMYKTENGYVITFEGAVSSDLNSGIIIPMTINLLSENKVDISNILYDESNIDLDFQDYDLEDMYIDMVNGKVIRKAWEIITTDSKYAVTLQMHWAHFTLRVIQL